MSYQEPYSLTDSYILFIVFLNEISRWVPVSSTGKVSDDCIRDLGFNPRLHQKLIGVLV